MDDTLKEIKSILEEEASLLIDNKEDLKELSKEGNNISKTVIDNRLNKIKELIDSYENKDDTYYSKLVKLLSDYIEDLYERSIDFCKVNLANDDEDTQEIDTICFNGNDSFILKKANRELSEKLFNYVCSILESNKDVKLDIETLKKLFNRKPTRLTMSIEDDYVYRTLHYERLSHILKKIKH